VNFSPAVVNPTSTLPGMVYVGSEDGNVYALNASTGAELWHFTTEGFYVFSPAVVNGVVYDGDIGFDSGNVYALDAMTGAEVWSTGNFATASPAVAGGVVYIGGSSMTALITNTGNTLWQASSPAADNTPAVADRAVYFAAFGSNYALNASNGAVLWQYAGVCTCPVQSSPAVANGVVYVGVGLVNGGSLDALDASSGDVLWQYITGGNVNSSPAVANGVVYVGSDDGNVYAFSLPTPPQAPERPDPAALRPDTSLRK
jgi:outer membrane protein assembly factor BamB